MARLPNGMTMTITGRTADALTVTVNADEWAARRLAEVRAHLVAGGTLDDALANAFPPAPSPDAMHLDAWDERCEQVSGSGYTRHGGGTSPDAMRLDASCAEADAELAEWRALLDGAKGRRRG